MSDPVKHGEKQQINLKYLQSVIQEQPLSDVPQTPIDPEILGKRIEDPSEPTWKEDVETDVNKIVPLVQTHKHTFICCNNGGKTCRFHFPRNVNLEAKFQNGIYLLERQAGAEFINNYNKWIAYVLRNNHDIQHITNGPDSKSVHFCISDYITKAQLKSHQILALILMAQDSLEKYPIPNRKNLKEAEHQARSLVMKCLNKITTHKERSGPDVASFLLGYGDSNTDQSFVNLYLYDLLKWTGQMTLDDEDDAEVIDFNKTLKLLLPKIVFTWSINVWIINIGVGWTMFLFMTLCHCITKLKRSKRQKTTIFVSLMNILNINLIV